MMAKGTFTICQDPDDAPVHSQGPWEAVVKDDGSFFIIAADCMAVTGRDACGPYPERSKANATLIAAAPLLLEALILLEREMVLSGNAESIDYGWKPAILKTHAAIAKAEGRS